MSNIYLLEPHTSGKVILHTNYGDIAIELWPKEAPKACRNFVQLCMEGYYDSTIFHRIVTGFIIQGGDPEGTGLGGDSIYEGGKPFADEFHSRLRFVRRGLVAMANTGKPNDNRSQFFITLDTTLELQNKHTIFGKIGGDTIYNVLKIGGLEVDSNERPLYPPEITHCTIVVNPFDDIVPRVSRRELELAAKLKEQQEAIKKVDKPKKLKKNVALLSFGDDAHEDEEDEGVDKSKAKKKKMLSSHDLLADDPTLIKETDHGFASEVLGDLPLAARKSKKDKKETKDEEKKRKKGASDNEENDEDESQESPLEFDRRMRDQVRERHKKSKLNDEPEEHRLQSTTPSSSSKPASTAPSTGASASVLSESERRRQEIQKLEEDIRQMNNRGSNADEEEESSKGKKLKTSLLKLEREQYKTRGELSGGKKGGRRGLSKYNADKERDVMEKLAAFEAKVFSSAREEEPNPVAKLNDGPPCKIHGIPSCESCKDSMTKKKELKENENEEEQEGMKEDDNDDTDFGWMQHKLVFEKDLKGKEVSLSAKRDDVDDYIVIDPRDKAEATTAAMAMEKQRSMDKKKQESRGRDHGRVRQDDRQYGTSSLSSRADHRQHGRSSRDQRDYKGSRQDDDRRKFDNSNRGRDREYGRESDRYSRDNWDRDRSRR